MLIPVIVEVSIVYLATGTGAGCVWTGGAVVVSDCFEQDIATIKTKMDKIFFILIE